MADPNQPSAFKDLQRRIDKARGLPTGESGEGGAAGESDATGMAVATRMAVEIVVTLAVCTGLGWVFDQWFGTTPWLMLVFLVLGAGAGVTNAVRTSNRMTAEAMARLQEGTAGADRTMGADKAKGAGGAAEKGERGGGR